MLLTVTINAGTTLVFQEDADFFRYLEGVGTLNVDFYKKGRRVAEADSIKPGYCENFETYAFDRLEIYSATTQQIQFVTRMGSVVAYDAAPTGAVTLSGMQGTFIQAGATVTTASAQLLAGNALRRYLLIQNKDLTGDIYLNLAGVAASAANGLLLKAGESYEASPYCPISAIFAIGTIASNANVVVIED